MAVGEGDDVHEVSPAAVVAVRDPVAAEADAHRGQVGGEAEAAQDVVEEDGDLETVAATAAGVGDDVGEGGLRVDRVGVSGVVVEPEVFVGNGGYGMDVQLGEEIEVCGGIDGVAVGLERGWKVDV